eukprot:2418812-Pyramimonas_sp.AAC.1
MEGGSFSKCGSRLSTVDMLLKSLQQFPGFAWFTSQQLCFGAMSDCHGATVKLMIGAEVPDMVFWHDSGSSRRNSIIIIVWRHHHLRHRHHDR